MSLSLSSSRTALVGVLVLAVLCGPAVGERFSRCDLADALRDNDVPASDLGTWVCIAERLSSISTDAMTTDDDGNAYHGLFLISDQWWCDRGAKGCGVSCADMKRTLDSNIKCAKKVFEETSRIEGDGFKAWRAYDACDDPETYVARCNAAPGAKKGSNAENKFSVIDLRMSSD